MDKSEQFDRAFSEETALDVLKRILGSFDIDIMAQGSRVYGLTYTARLWEDGGEVAEVIGTSLEGVLARLDQSAEALVRAYNA